MGVWAAGGGVLIICADVLQGLAQIEDESVHCVDFGSASHVLSVSGGKDSQALLCLAIEAGVEFRAIFADTGNECHVTLEHLDYLEQALGIRIERYKADLTGMIWHRRRFIAQDNRPENLRYPRAIKRRALGALRPTGNPFLDLCLIKGQFPRRRVLFCTQVLKRDVIHDNVFLPLLRAEIPVVSWQGVRRDESAARAHVAEWEQECEGIYNYRPLADMTALDAFAISRRHGLKPNPLYKLGFKRVGCMPCINTGKTELLSIERHFPKELDRIRDWETLVSMVSTRGVSTFFGADKIPGTDGGPGRAHIENVRAWAKTVRGGRQFGFLHDLHDSTCQSFYGLCE